MEQEIKIIVLVNGDLLISAVEEVAALDIGDPNCKMISPSVSYTHLTLPTKA